jgi:hypothetical protein
MLGVRIKDGILVITAVPDGQGIMVPQMGIFPTLQEAIDYINGQFFIWFPSSNPPSTWKCDFFKLDDDVKLVLVATMNNNRNVSQFP